MARSTRNVLTWWNDYLTSSLRRHWMSAFMIDVILMNVITFPSGIAKQQQMLKPFKAISHFIRNKFLPTLFQQKVSYLLVTHTKRERERKNGEKVSLWKWKKFYNYISFPSFSPKNNLHTTSQYPFVYPTFLPPVAEGYNVKIIGKSRADVRLQLSVTCQIPLSPGRWPPISLTHNSINLPARIKLDFHLSFRFSLHIEEMPHYIWQVFQMKSISISLSLSPYAVVNFHFRNLFFIFSLSNTAFKALQSAAYVL